jgi:hypothetical protein
MNVEDSSRPIAISSHTVSKSTMVGFIKHFYEYGKPHYTVQLLNSTKFNLSLVIRDSFIYCDCIFSQRSIVVH